MESPVLRIEVSSTSLRMELPMSETNSVSPLRQRMIEDMAARKLNPHTQRSHVYSCKRFAAWLNRSPDTATPDEVRRFQLYLIESRRRSVRARARPEALNGCCPVFPPQHKSAAPALPSLHSCRSRPESTAPGIPNSKIPDWKPQRTTALLAYCIDRGSHLRAASRFS